VTLAHALIGDAATPAQIAVTVVGLALVVLGGIAAFTTPAPGNRRARMGKSLGVPALLLGLVAIFIGPEVVTRFNSRCSVRPSTSATIEVLSPSNGQRFGSNAVPVRVRLEGGALAPATVDERRPGEGHLQISVDRVAVTRAANPVQVVRVPDGSHRIAVEYVAGDHLPFCPKVVVNRSVEVQE
jgi:hypothetical protein